MKNYCTKITFLFILTLVACPVASSGNIELISHTSTNSKNISTPPTVLGSGEVIFPSSISEADIIVAQDGSGDYSTIQEAADVAQAGDIIFIKEGNYKETVIPQYSGSSENYIFFIGAENENVVIDAELNRSSCVSIINKSYIALKNITLTGAIDENWEGGALYINQSSSNIILDSVTVDNNQSCGVHLMGLSGTISNITIRNSTITNSKFHGIKMYSMIHNILIENSNISYNGGDNEGGHNIKAVVWSEHGNDSGPTYIYIRNNEISHSGYQGIHLWNARYVLVQDNFIHHNLNTGIQVEDGCQNILIEDNITEYNSLRYNTEGGIWVDDAFNVVVRNNITRHNQIGLLISKSNQVVVYNNTINSNSSPSYDTCGLMVTQYDEFRCENIRFFHNTLHENGSSESFSAINIGAWNSTIEGLSFFNNIISESNGVSDITVTCNNYLSKGNFFFNSENGLINNYGYDYFTLDPKFVDIQNNNFMLDNDSPCIESAVTLTQTSNSGSGIEISVNDSYFFTDGMNISEGSFIRIGNEQNLEIVNVDYNLNRITVDRPITWSSGDNVNYQFSGGSPTTGNF